MGRRLLLCALAALACSPAAAARADLRAGAAAADITPPVGTPMFAYTARSKLANPDHLAQAPELFADPDPNLYAKSFVASRGIHTRVLARPLVPPPGPTQVAPVQAAPRRPPYRLT